MQSQIFNKTFEDLTITRNASTPAEPTKPAKIDRRISIDTYNVDRSETDNYDDELLAKRAQPGDKRPAFEVYCESYSATNEGEYLRKLDGREIYLFRCPLNHKFMLTKKQVISSIWCTSCAKTLDAIHKHAAANGGEVLSPSLSRSLRLRCKLGHEFELSYKKAASRWCKDCSKSSKRKLKDLIEQENKRIEDEKCREQVR